MTMLMCPALMYPRIIAPGRGYHYVGSKQQQSLKYSRKGWPPMRCLLRARWRQTLYLTMEFEIPVPTGQGQVAMTEYLCNANTVNPPVLAAVLCQ